MSETDLKLRHAPIVEAVLDIDCDFKPDQKLKYLETSARKRLLDQYPKTRTRVMQQVQIEAKDSGPVSHSVQQGELQAFQFLHEDEKQLVQVRVEGYSFNRLAPYASFDDYLPEIRRTWNLYREIASPIQVRSLRLRYINRIYLPLVAGGVQLDDYFKVGPRLPDEDRLKLTGFLNQHTAIEADTGHQVTTIFTAQRVENDRLPIIFDNTVIAAAVSVVPEDWDRLEATLKSLRALKNHVFRNTLTDKCLSLFQ